MQSRRFILLFLLFFFPFFNGISSEPDIDDPELKSIKEKIQAEGWNNPLLDQLAFEIKNSSLNSDLLSRYLSTFNNSTEAVYLNSLILKKDENFSEMFDTLYTQLTRKPAYYPYYNELVYSANASDKLEVLEVFKQETTSYQLYLKALISFERGKYNESLGYLNKAHLIDSSVSIIHQTALVYRNLGNYKKSADYFRILLTMPDNYEAVVLQALSGLGAIYFLSGDYISSDKYYSDAYKLAIKINDRQAEAKLYINLGINESVKGNSELARDLFNKGFETAHSISDADLKALALSELGVYYNNIYDLPNAKLNYLYSYDIFKKTGNKIRLSYLSENLGKIYSLYHDYTSAIKYFEEGIRFAGENKRALYLNTSGLAGVHNNLSNYSRSLELYRKAHKIADEIDDNSLNAESDAGIGLINFNLGRYDNALRYYSSADSFFRKSDDIYFRADILHKKALVYLRMDSLSEAENAFKEAFELAGKSGDEYLQTVILINNAELKLKKNELIEIKPLLKQAEAKAVKNNFDNLLAELYLLEGQLYSENKDYNAAKEKFTRSADISRLSSNYGLLTEAYYNQAKLHSKFNLIEAAESFYLSAVNEAENKGRPLFEEQDVQISYYNLQRELYESFASLYIKEGKYNEAFGILDRGRSRNTVQNLNNLKLRLIIDDDNIIDQLHEFDWMVHSGIYKSSLLDSLTSVYTAYKEALISKYPESESYLSGGRFYSTNEIKKHLSADEQIIFIHHLEESTYLFRLSKDELNITREELSTEEISKMISEISPYYSASAGTYYNQDLFAYNALAANQLYTRLLKNTLSKVPENSSIVFIPSSELLLLPFELLVTEFTDNESAYNYSDKPFLVNKYNISYSPSVSLYITQKMNSIENEEKYLLVGNPYINNKAELVSDRRTLLGEGNTDIQPLKYSAEEIDEIGSILQTNRILTERDATESNFRQNASGSRIIHISTHSFLMNNQPVIFFSNESDPDNDGFLEASEVTGMKLNTDLVVLSSCNSGGGKLEEAEGIIGMTKAFFEAGTKSIIVSLWEVNDKYTSAFMGLFYNHLSNGLSKTEALRKAKMDFIKNYSPNPYYWSAFVLAGNTSGIKLNRGTEFSTFIIPAFILFASLSLILFYYRRKRSALNNPL